MSRRQHPCAYKHLGPGHTRWPGLVGRIDQVDPKVSRMQPAVDLQGVIGTTRQYSQELEHVTHLLDHSDESLVPKRTFCIWSSRWMSVVPQDILCTNDVLIIHASYLTLPLGQGSVLCRVALSALTISHGDYSNRFVLVTPLQ
jgi:hypothetical protein